MKLSAILNKLFTPFFICNVYEIPVFIHWSWLWMILFIYSISPTTSLLILSILMIHILHELGHLFFYNYFGIKPDKTTIYLTGGYSIIPTHVFNYNNRIITSLAGPLINLSLIPVFQYIDNDFLNKLSYFNLLILFLNLMPSFPLDCGLILEHYLYNQKKQKYFLIISKLIVSLIGLYGIWTNTILLVIIALLLYYVIQEEKALQ